MRSIDDKYICTCCGGRINRATMTCEYCGTQYKYEFEQVMRIETYHNPVTTIMGGCVIPRHEAHCIGAENMAEMAMSRIQGEIAAALTDVMRYDIEFDPQIMAYRVRGQMRAVIPQENGAKKMLEVMRK